MNENSVSGESIRRRRNGKILTEKELLIVLSVLVIIGVLILGFTIKDINDKAAAAEAENAMIDTEEILFEPEEIVIEEDPADAYPYYYDAQRETRYAMFADDNPEIAIEDVYWMVNCDLDFPPYVDSIEIADPDDLLLLVNKRYHLPDGYTPPDLVSVGKTLMRPEAAEAMLEMIADAAAEGHILWSQSGYRSYDLQTQLYNNYSARDGEVAADTYSARPGHSEHQTGLATDLNTITDAFGNTPEGIWAAENCWKYGYIVRYTADNLDITLYKSEPWHMRYIGLEAAKIMHDEQIESFEEYWVKYIKYSPPVKPST